MEFLAVSLAALVVSGLALFSGFGLGTLLMPVFALFFPVRTAVAATAVVHLANNVFKVAIVGRRSNWKVVLAFGLPAASFALLGAFLLVRVAEVAPIVTYELWGREFTLTAVKVVVAVLIIGFALFEMLPLLRRVEFDRKYVPVGGAVSGFFGGLSGHQGALRSAVLARAGLGTPEFVGTTSVCALLVDLSRLAVYGVSFFGEEFVEVGEVGPLVGTATLAAFVGTYGSSRLLEKVTMVAVRRLVGVMLVVLGLALAAGLV